ncbi:hypothetical protein ACJX0J_041580, partial [Zea mays]
LNSQVSTSSRVECLVIWVSAFFLHHFSEVADYSFTAKMRQSVHKVFYPVVEAAAVRADNNHLGGLVRYPVSATLPQIGSRLFLTWGVFWSFPE